MKFVHPQGRLSHRPLAEVVQEVLDHVATLEFKPT